MAVSEHDFDAVTDLSVSKESLDKFVVNLDVGSSGRAWGRQGLQQNVSRDEELLLLVNKLDATISISKVVDGEGLCVHVFTNTPHLYSVRCEETSSILEITSRETNGVISFAYDKHSHNLFVSVYNEISSKFVHVFS